ncbi:hypothetical protein [Pedobacter sp. BMA]|uniref:hypothetical protein n=1 Tax=Pedobacter sp. BMA TaxID=1663685 RepID=UPI00064A5020|nr:hypothetical protein [Pedobacter sp. BMA]KLT66903.1 hypothetical protein AB669_02970 [Pedobacter sp. BMA]
MKIKTLLMICAISIFLTSCAPYQQLVTFPPAKDVFITSGDGNIQKPYTPIGEFVYAESGYKIGLPLIGLLNIKSVDAEEVLRQRVTTKIKESGGDGLINMKLNYTPSTNGILGLLAKPSTLYITGTIIKR